MDEVRHLGQEALKLIHEQYFAAAINKIHDIESKTPNGSEKVFCHFAIAKAQLLSGNIKEGLENANFSLESLTLSSQQRKKPSEIIEIDFFAELEKLSIGPISDQLKEFFQYAFSDSTIRQMHFLAYSSFGATDEQRAFAQLLKERQLKSIPALLAPFVRVEISENHGIRFDFTDKLSKATQLKILQNLQDFNGHDFTLPHKLSDNFTREADFIKALIAENKHLWCQARAYYTAAFLRTQHKPEHAALGLFYLDANNKLIFRHEYDFENHYDVLLSMFHNNLISEMDYTKFLWALREQIMNLKSISQEVSVESEESAEFNTVEIDVDQEDTTFSQQKHDDKINHDDTSESELTEEQEQTCRTLIDEIECQLLLYDPQFSSEDSINIFYNDQNNGSVQGPEFSAFRKRLLGENFGKDYFESVWNICWHNKAMRIAAFLLCIPQIITLVASSIFYVCIYWPYMHHQLKNKPNRDETKIQKDNETLNKRRDTIKGRLFLSLWKKDQDANSLQNRMFTPRENENHSQNDKPVPQGFSLITPRKPAIMQPRE